MNKAQLCRSLSLKTSIQPKVIQTVIENLEDTICQSLALGERVSVVNFGTFYVKKTKSRAIPNPKIPGQKIITLGKRVVKFIPSENFKEKIEQQGPSFSSTEERLLKIRTRPIKISYIDLKKRKIPKEILSKIPERVARTYKLVPVEEKNGRLVIAMINPEDLEAIEFVKKKTGMDLEIGITTTADLEAVLDQYAGITKEVERAIEEVEKEEKKEKKKEIKIETGLETPVARLVNSLLSRAVKDRASDIHIEPEENDLLVRYRIDGVLQKAVTLPAEIHPSVVARIKVLSNLKIDETRVPQDGRFTMQISGAEVDFRVSTLPTVFGEKVVLRILDKSKGILTLEELGLMGRAFDCVNENIHKAHGMTLVTGPTGSGKTTTLYAIIDKIQDVGINIVTLEDPVEYRLKGINQSQVNPAVNYTFATGLRSIVRQDPDVIMVGEIRDTETASIAIHAALTGHVVLSTLHTNDAAGAVPRLIDMKIEPFLIASSLNLVIAQRLCRRICENCKQTHHPPQPVVDDVKKELLKIKEDRSKTKEIVFYKGRGCSLCNNTGYKGRIGIFEVLPVTPEIKQLIMQKASSDSLAQQAKKEGFLSLKQDGIKKVLLGLTTIEEVLRVTKE